MGRLQWRRVLAGTLAVPLVIVAGLSLGAARPAAAETLFGVSLINVLRSFDSATPGTISSSVTITGLQAGESVLGIDFRPSNGLLYALGSTSRLYTINTTTGAATQVGAAGAFTLSGTAFGMDFNPTVDRIRVVSNTGQNLRLNPNDGTLTATDTALAYAAGDPNVGATPHIVGSAYTNNFDGAATTTLFGIDSTLNNLVSQNPPNAGTLNTVGGLGFDTSDLVGFDVSGVTGIAYASLTAPAGNFSNLFSINLATGTATLIGSIGGGGPVTSLAAPIGIAPTAPEPGALPLLLTVVGAASSFVAARRRTLRK